jgi:hypothetical protein
LTADGTGQTLLIDSFFALNTYTFTSIRRLLKTVRLSSPFSSNKVWINKKTADVCTTVFGGNTDNLQYDTRNLTS